MTASGCSSFTERMVATALAACPCLSDTITQRGSSPGPVQERQNDPPAIGGERCARIDRTGVARRVALEQSAALVGAEKGKHLAHGRQLRGKRLHLDQPLR